MQMDIDSQLGEFHIGELKIPGDLILAPMDGFSIYPFRIIVRKLGSAASYSEFINARDIINGHPHLAQRIYFSNEERPFFYQLVDNDPDRLLTAALALRRKDPDAIDINLGCPTPSISGRGAGAGLLRDPKKIEVILTSLCKALDIPITAKIRLGWDEHSKNYLEVAKIIENSGCKAIAVHGRTRNQGYSGSADWNAIGEIKNIVSIPVIGNGDILSINDTEKMKGDTGCDAIMIGRAAIQNPWIFSKLERDEVPAGEVLNTIKTQLNLMQSFYGGSTGIILFRKFLVRYLSLLKVKKAIRISLLQEMDAHVLMEKIEQLLEFTS